MRVSTPETKINRTYGRYAGQQVAMTVVVVAVVVLVVHAAVGGIQVMAVWRS